MASVKTTPTVTVEPCAGPALPLQDVDAEGRVANRPSWEADDSMENVGMVEAVPPNGGYGWVCTFAVLLINAHTWGVNAVSLVSCKASPESRY